MAKVGVVAIFVLFVVWSVVIRMLIQKAADRAEGKVKQVVPEGESKLAEVFVETRDLRFKGFVQEDQLGGKLVVTPSQLVYCRVNEKKIGIVLQQVHVVSIEVGSKGLVVKTPTLVLRYHPPKKPTKEKIATFKVRVGGMDPARFVELIGEWKQQHAAA